MRDNPLQNRETENLKGQVNSLKNNIARLHDNNFWIPYNDLYINGPLFRKGFILIKEKKQARKRINSPTRTANGSNNFISQTFSIGDRTFYIQKVKKSQKFSTNSNTCTLYLIKNLNEVDLQKFKKDSILLILKDPNSVIAYFVRDNKLLLNKDDMIFSIEMEISTLENEFLIFTSKIMEYQNSVGNDSKYYEKKLKEKEAILKENDTKIVKNLDSSCLVVSGIDENAFFNSKLITLNQNSLNNPLENVKKDPLIHKLTKKILSQAGFCLPDKTAIQKSSKLLQKLCMFSQENLTFLSNSVTIFNTSHRNEIFLPLVINSNSSEINKQYALYVNPWLTNERDKEFNFSGFEIGVTAGCMFGTSLKGIDQFSYQVPIIKHNLDLHPDQKIAEILFDPEETVFYEQILWHELQSLSQLMTHLSAKEKPKKLVYHLPYIDYILFGVELYIRNRMSYEALCAFTAAILVKKQFCEKKISQLCQSYAIDITINSPFENLFKDLFWISDIFELSNAELNEIENFTSNGESQLEELLSKYRAINTTLYKEMANLLKHPHQVETVLKNETFFKHILKPCRLDDLLQQYPTFEDLLDQSWVIDAFLERLVGINEQSFKEENDTQREKEKRLVHYCLEQLMSNQHNSLQQEVWKDFITSHLWGYEVSLLATSEYPSPETVHNTATLIKIQANESRPDSFLVYGQDSQGTFCFKEVSAIHEALFASIDFTKSKLFISSDNEHAGIYKLFTTLGYESPHSINNLEELFKMANAVMIGVAAKGREDNKICSFLPVTEKQIAVSYAKCRNAYHRMTGLNKYPHITNLTFIDPVITYSYNCKQGQAFYFDSCHETLSNLLEDENISLLNRAACNIGFFSKRASSTKEVKAKFHNIEVSNILPPQPIKKKDQTLEAIPVPSHSLSLFNK